MIKPIYLNHEQNHTSETGGDQMKYGTNNWNHRDRQRPSEKQEKKKKNNRRREAYVNSDKRQEFPQDARIKTKGKKSEERRSTRNIRVRARKRSGPRRRWHCVSSSMFVGGWSLEEDEATDNRERTTTAQDLCPKTKINKSVGGVSGSVFGRQVWGTNVISRASIPGPLGVPSAIWLTGKFDVTLIKNI